MCFAIPFHLEPLNTARCVELGQWVICICSEAHLFAANNDLGLHFR